MINYKPRTEEYMHEAVMGAFHEYRSTNGNGVLVTISGKEMNQIVTKAKKETIKALKEGKLSDG